MALRDAILACLTERPMTGYELAKNFGSSIGFFWRADHQQIYRELNRLHVHGDVTVEEVIQSGRPNKLVYSITQVGRGALRRWSTLPSAPPTMKDDLLVRLYALEDVDKDSLRLQLATRLEHHIDRLNRYERILLTRYTDRSLSVRDTGRLLGLELGLGYERIWVEWCSSALTRLQSGDVAAPAADVVVPIRR